MVHEKFMKITWEPIHFDDRRKPDDLVAVAFGIGIGRIYRVHGGARQGDWYFNFQLGRPPFRTSAMNGFAEKRKAAQQHVLQTFMEFLETPSELGGGRAGVCHLNGDHHGPTTRKE